MVLLPCVEEDDWVSSYWLKRLLVIPTEDIPLYMACSDLTCELLQYGSGYHWHESHTVHFLGILMDYRNSLEEHPI